MNEAINRLKQTIEKYRVLLGEERVSFESASLRAMEDLNSQITTLEERIEHSLLRMLWPL